MFENEDSGMKIKVDCNKNSTNEMVNVDIQFMAEVDGVFGSSEGVMQAYEGGNGRVNLENSGDNSL